MRRIWRSLFVVVLLTAACGAMRGVGEQSQTQGENLQQDNPVAPTGTSATTTSHTIEPPREQEGSLRDLTVPGHPIVDGSLVTIEATDDQIDVVITTRKLSPGHPMTAWLVPLDGDGCLEAFPAIRPCQPFVLTAGERPDLGNIHYLGGGLSDADGNIFIKGTVNSDALATQASRSGKGWWFETEVESFRTALFHVVIRDHGPPIDGIIAEMWQTFRGGCTDDSLGTGVPDHVLAIGSEGPNTCFRTQSAVLPPVEMPSHRVPPELDVRHGTVRIEPATVPVAGDQRLTVTGSNFIGGTDVVVAPCTLPGHRLVRGEVSLGEINVRMGSIDLESDCRLDRALHARVAPDGTFTVSAAFEVAGRPGPGGLDGANFVIYVSSLDGAQYGGAWLPVEFRSRPQGSVVVY